MKRECLVFSERRATTALLNDRQRTCDNYETHQTVANKSIRTKAEDGHFNINYVQV